MSWETNHDVVLVASEQLPGVKEAIWLYAPFVMVTLLNLQYIIWAMCTGGRAWKRHKQGAFSRSFFFLLANIWLTNLLHGCLVLMANIHTFAPTKNHVTPVLVSHHFGNTSSEILGPGGRWGLVLRLGVPLTVATHALSNMAAIALTMNAEATLVASTACARCDVVLATSFRSRVLSIVAGLWTLDLLLIFYPLLGHMVHETFFQTALYSWLAYVGVMAEVWIFVLCGLAYHRARRMHRDDPDYCPAEVLSSIRRKTFIILPMTLITAFTLLPWPLCEIVYTDEKLYRIISPYLLSYLKGTDTKALYDYLCALPYLHFLLESILVIAFRETRWRLCLGQRNAMIDSNNKRSGQNCVANHNERKSEEKQHNEQPVLRTPVENARRQQEQYRTSFLQGSLFVENLETLRAHIDNGNTGTLSRRDNKNSPHTYYNTIQRETTV